jgi:hypothetical protein
LSALEVLSPSNKSGKGRQAYLAQRFEYRHHNINLVEIDLLLGGDRVPLLAPLPCVHYARRHASSIRGVFMVRSGTTPEGADSSG